MASPSTLQETAVAQVAELKAAKVAQMVLLEDTLHDLA